MKKKKEKLVSLKIEDILKSQRNKYPLLFIDKVISCNPGIAITSKKNFSYNEWFFPAHFDDEPNVPGFVQIECLVQSFIMIFLSQSKFKNNKTNFIKTNATFKKKIIPGDTLIIKSKLNSFDKGIATGVSNGFVDNKLVCTASFTVSIPKILEKYLPKN